MRNLRNLACPTSRNAFASSQSKQYAFTPRNFRMIRDGDFADHGAFQKATRETFERYGFLKRALVLIG
jgi:hypothetical protein